MADAAKSSLSLMKALCLVPDPRSCLGRRHALPAVSALPSVAVMCGCRSVYAALQWGRDQGAETVAKLGRGEHGVFTDEMMSNLLRRLDVGTFDAAAIAIDRLAGVVPIALVAFQGRLGHLDLTAQRVNGHHSDLQVQHLQQVLHGREFLALAVGFLLGKYQVVGVVGPWAGQPPKATRKG